MNITNIDWKRMAKPQDDAYDQFILYDLDEERLGWYCPPVTSKVTLAEGHIAVAPPRMNMSMGAGSRLALDNATQEWADQQTVYLSAWETGYGALCYYLDEFWPFESANGGRGCSSGHFVMTKDIPYHAVYVTINDRQGCAQGIYHEYAHLRLETMGIYVESHDGRLLTNDPSELYNSSVRFDVKRPMSAVLHGLYSWLMFTENDYQLYKAGVSTLDELNMYSSHNLPKIIAGTEEVYKYAKWTSEGRAFADGLFDWSDDLVDRCYAALDTMK